MDHRALSLRVPHAAQGCLAPWDLQLPQNRLGVKSGYPKPDKETGAIWAAEVGLPLSWVRLPSTQFRRAYVEFLTWLGITGQEWFKKKDVPWDSSKYPLITSWVPDPMLDTRGIGMNRSWLFSRK